jgi:hypothetical protein
MQTEQITMDPVEARLLWLEYRRHQQHSDPIDREIERVYREIAKGRVVIRAMESVRAAGLGEDRLPKLAIVRADAAMCYLKPNWNGGARMQAKKQTRDNETRSYIDFPAGSFPGIDSGKWRAEAMVPLIPLKYRPKTALASYSILFEAEWRKVVPTDPMLLRRVGDGDVWIVVAAWDLTEVERSVMAQRLSG